MPYSQNSKIVHNYVITEVHNGEKVDLKVTPSHFFWKQIDKIAKPTGSLYDNEVCLVFRNDKEVESKHAHGKTTSVVLLIGEISTRDLHIHFKEGQIEPETSPFCWVLKGKELCPETLEDVILYIHQTIDNEFFKGFILPYAYSCWWGIYNKETDSFITSCSGLKNFENKIIGERVERVDGGRDLPHTRQKVFRVKEGIFQQQTDAISQAIKDYCS